MNCLFLSTQEFNDVQFILQSRKLYPLQINERRKPNDRQNMITLNPIKRTIATSPSMTSNNYQQSTFRHQAKIQGRDTKKERHVSVSSKPFERRLPSLQNSQRVRYTHLQSSGHRLAMPKELTNGPVIYDKPKRKNCMEKAPLSLNSIYVPEYDK